MDLPPKEFLLEGKGQKKRSSSGNLVNLGNSDSNGINVNNWKPDNSNPNIGIYVSLTVLLSSPL